MKVSAIPPSAEGLRQLIDSSCWAIKVAWSTHKSLVLGLGLATLARGLFPAALALVIRGLINTAVEPANNQAEALTSLLPWVVLGLGLTVLEVVSSLSYRFLMQRFADDIDLSITSKIDVAFFEDPLFRTSYIEPSRTLPPISLGS